MPPCESPLEPAACRTRGVCLCAVERSGVTSPLPPLAAGRWRLTQCRDDAPTRTATCVGKVTRDQTGLGPEGSDGVLRGGPRSG